MINKRSGMLRFFSGLIFLYFIFSSCSAPRTILHSGKVTPHKQLRAGIDYAANIATQPLKILTGNTRELIDVVTAQDSIVFSDVIPTLNKAALSYALDPFGSGFHFYGRYGIVKGLDIGYKYSGVHVFDTRYQFMGSKNSSDDPDQQGTYGSIGLQFSSQSYDLPFGLDKLQNFIGFDFKRKDFLLPLAFSNSFGPEEQYGGVSYGLVYGHTFIEYSFNPQKIYRVNNIQGANFDTIPIPSVSGKNNFPSFGTFINIKFGYQYVYGLISFAMYYQKYGTYSMLGGETVKLKGFSFLPSAGLFFDIPLKKRTKKKAD